MDEKGEDYIILIGAPIQVATMLADHKQTDKRTTLRNQNLSATMGRPAMKLLGGGGGGGGFN